MQPLVACEKLCCHFIISEEDSQSDREHVETIKEEEEKDKMVR